jgi:nitrite reductase (NO-forming)
VLAEVGPNIWFNYWTYDGSVPGPMLRVREGDTVYLSLTNDPSSLHVHTIDLHAVSGPGGGSAIMNTHPGETKAFKWKALHAGLYVYHCATMNVSVHNSHGQYGLILVEPEEGLAPADKEFYLMQGEIYTAGGLGRQGLMAFDAQALLDGNPSYVTFNGRVQTQPKMQVKRGERVRIFVGNGGLNLISSFHVIGAIFDRVYPEGAMGNGSPQLHNLQTTLVPPGGAAIVEFTADVPGPLTVVDHALARMNKGAWAIINVVGDPNPDVYAPADLPVRMSAGPPHPMQTMEMQ